MSTQRRKPARLGTERLREGEVIAAGKAG